MQKPIEDRYISGRTRLAFECIERINHMWFEGNDEEYPIEKIDAMFDALSVLAPYNCCFHVHYMWFSYRTAKVECLWHLARYRHRLFSNALRNLHELANKTS